MICGITNNKDKDAVCHAGSHIEEEKSASVICRMPSRAHREVVSLLSDFGSRGVVDVDVCDLDEVLADIYLVVLSVGFRKVLYVLSMLRKHILDLLYQKCTCPPMWISRTAFKRFLRLSAPRQASSYKKAMPVTRYLSVFSSPLLPVQTSGLSQCSARSLPVQHGQLLQLLCLLS